MLVQFYDCCLMKDNMTGHNVMTMTMGQTWGQFNSRIGIAYLKKMEFDLKLVAKHLFHKLIYHLIF